MPSTSSINVKSNYSHPLAFGDGTALTASVAKPTVVKTKSLTKTTLTCECRKKTADATLSKSKLLKKAAALPYKEGTALMQQYSQYTYTDEEIWKEIGGIPKEKIIKRIEDLRKLFPEHYLNYAACNMFGCAVNGHTKEASGKSEKNLFLLSSGDAKWQKFDALYSERDSNWIRRITTTTKKDEIVMEVYLRTASFHRTINDRFAVSVELNT